MTNLLLRGKEIAGNNRKGFRNNRSDDCLILLIRDGVFSTKKSSMKLKIL